MCSVMAGIGAALSLFQGYSNYQAQKSAVQAQADSYASYLRAQAQANEYNAKVNERNAAVEARKQEQIADNYGAEQRKLRDRQRIAAGNLRATTGAAGLDFAGSSLDIASSGQEAYWEDQATLLGNQRNDNYASRVTESNYLNTAGQYRNQAENSRRQAQATLDDADRQIGALGMSSILGTAMSMTPFLSGLGGGSKSTGSSSVATGWNANTGKYVLRDQDYTFGNINYATPWDKSLGTGRYGLRLG